MVPVFLRYKLDYVQSLVVFCEPFRVESKVLTTASKALCYLDLRHCNLISYYSLTLSGETLLLPPICHAHTCHAMSFALLQLLH